MQHRNGHVPLEKRTIRIEENGVRRDIPAIDKYWVVDRAFPRYSAPPLYEDSTLPVGGLESWLELTELLLEDLSWLLHLPHHCFWSQVILTKAPVTALTSFLQEAPPAYCQPKLPKNLEPVLIELSKLVFLVYSRLSTAKESPEHLITPSFLGEILYNNYIFTVPSLLDLCALYGVSNRSEVERILQDVTSMQPNYLQDFSMAEPHLTRVLEKADSMLAGDSRKYGEVHDLIVHVYDSLFTMRIFVDILPKGCDLFATPTFLSSISSFYTSVMPKIAKNSETKQLADSLRIECLQLVKTLLASVISKAVESKSSEHVENYLTLVSEIMSEGLFVCDYHSIYPIDADFDIITGICPDIDMMKLDYLTEALASHVDLKLKKKQGERPAESNIVNYPSTSSGSANARATSHVGGVELVSLITQVQDILPHLGAGFVEACLKHYDYSTERVIAAVLENSLPPSLEELNWNLDRPPLPVPERSNVFDFDEFDVRTNNTIDPARVYKGKKPRQHKNLNQMLEDKTEIREMKDKFANLGFIEDEYDDEYDDTYESQDVAVREPDEAERRRAFVVPRVLRTREVVDEEEEEEEEEEASEEAKRDQFVRNPVELRAKAELRRAQTRGQRDVVGKAKGQGQDKQVLINRDKKNVHKASSGNHHRRDRASKKRNQGMIPS